MVRSRPHLLATKAFQGGGFMKIDHHLLERLSRLSALHFPEEEKTKLRHYLRQTLSHFEKIRGIDTQGLEPLISPSPPLI